MGYNLLVVVGIWLLLGNVIALAQLVRPFKQNMVVHISLLMLLSLGSTAKLLGSGAPHLVPSPPTTGSDLHLPLSFHAIVQSGVTDQAEFSSILARRP
ncbi:hypothetical protein SAMN06265337_4201 [Hymenobacter gelipurpurascens]|uniref:Uncharacterized protein n=1 Tax=Hymenobacter gelipurpurascens TaxID=89968 RepID=A0A212UH76_9BACT|nr:hypothetical protein SAMN06265337_4201 [Hymenobacter gelipurpurascens]